MDNETSYAAVGNRPRFVPATVFVVLMLIACGVCPAPAQILSPLQIVRESDFGIDGLANANGVAVSPDGAHVYVVSVVDNALAAFSCDTGTGELTFVDIEREGSNGVSGLREPSSVTVAPDGNHVYATGKFFGTVAVFSRNPTTGALTFVEFKRDFHVTSFPSGVEGLRGANSVVVSPNNAHVYVVGTDEDSIVVFSRNLTTGALTHASTVTDGVGGVTGLNVVQDVAISSGGTNLYAVSDFDDTVVAFTRNTTTGALTFIEQEKNGLLGVTGLDGATAVTVSGSYVYVASRADDAVAAFQRVGGGALSFLNSYKDGVSGFDGLDGARDLAVAPNGLHVYVAGETESAVAVLSRNTGNGLLAFGSVVRDGAAGGDKLAQPRALAVAPNDTHVYVASLVDDAVTAFSRNVTTGALTLVDAYMEVAGLQYPRPVMLAPDGLDLYVGDLVDNAVSQFARNPVDGTIAFAGTWQDGVGGVDGLFLVEDVAVSPDNKHVYAVGYSDDAVVVFSRDSGTGALTFVEAQFDDSQGGTLTALDSAAAVLVSPDGAFVYVGSDFDSAITVFSRNATTGALTFVDLVQYSVEGVLGIARLSAMTLSPDGEHLYAVGIFQDTLAVFDRNPVNGELTFLQVLTDGVSGVDGLADPTAVVVSPGGNNVYVAANGDDAISRYSRNASTGALTYQGMVKDEVGGITTLNGVRGLHISVDGRRLYAASELDNALTVFERNLNNGALTLLESHVHGVANIDGLAGASAIAESSDEKYLYVTASTTGSLAVFERDTDDLIPEPTVPVGAAGALAGAMAAIAMIRLRKNRARS